MANFIVSYDLNGPNPSHEQMDNHLDKIGAARGRILETVWYVGFDGTASGLLDHVKSILGPEDLLVVVEAAEAAWTRLLIQDDALLKAWNDHR